MQRTTTHIHRFNLKCNFVVRFEVRTPLMMKIRLLEQNSMHAGNKEVKDYNDN